MLFPEEETVSSVVEKGTFYTPTAETVFDETPILQKAMLMIVPGAALSLILPYISNLFSLTQTIMALLLLAGFLTLVPLDDRFKLSTVLALIHLLWSAWNYVSGNILQVTIPAGIWHTVLICVVAAVDLGILVSFWLGISKIHPTASILAMICVLAFGLLLLLGIPAGGTPLLIAKLCAGLVCFAALLATAIKVRK